MVKQSATLSKKLIPLCFLLVFVFLNSFRVFRADHGQPCPTQDTWGDTITALREWESLTSRTDALKSTLSESTFEGSVDGVTVTVDGRQRTVDLKISDSAASKGSKLGTLIKEAHSDAVDRSLEAMTENLQELYASHFSAKK